MSNQVEHSDFLCLLLIIYFIIRISFFNYLAKILLGQPLFCENVNAVLYLIHQKYRRDVHV